VNFGWALTQNPTFIPRRDGDAQFQQELGGNAFLTPGLGRVRHGGNQVLQVVRNPRTTGAAGLPPRQTSRNP
jgi:hypothetical protein